MSDDLEVTPRQAAEMLRGDNPPRLLDVRNQWEHDISRIEGDVLIPLDTLVRRLGEIDRRDRLIVYCHHGRRSLIAVQYLKQEGFDAVSMAGGIDRWSAEVDPSIPRY